MPRKLYVTDERGLDDALAEIAAVNLSGALMWPWVIPYFDDWGRAEASARRIKTRIFPYFDQITVETVEAMLEAFAQAGLIQLYMDGGKRYMAIDREKWFRFQTHIHASKRTSEGSRYPAQPNSTPAEEKQPIAENRGKSRNCAETRASPSPSPSLSPTPSPSPSPPKRLITIDPRAIASRQAVKSDARNEAHLAEASLPDRALPVPDALMESLNRMKADEWSRDAPPPKKADPPLVGLGDAVSQAFSGLNDRTRNAAVQPSSVAGATA